MGLQGRDGGAAGDFMIVVHVEKHPFFERDGLDIICPVPISFYQAMLGGYVQVPALEGIKKIKISKGLQSGAEIRLKGQGCCVREEQQTWRYGVPLSYRNAKKDLAQRRKNFCSSLQNSRFMTGIGLWQHSEKNCRNSANQFEIPFFSQKTVR